MKMPKEFLQELIHIVEQQAKILQAQPDSPLKKDLMNDCTDLQQRVGIFEAKYARPEAEVSTEEHITGEDMAMEQAITDFMDSQVRHCRQALKDKQNIVPFHNAMTDAFNAIDDWTKEHRDYCYLTLGQQKKNFNLLTDELNAYLKQQENFQLEHQVSINLANRKPMSPEVIAQTAQNVEVEDEEDDLEDDKDSVRASNFFGKDVPIGERASYEGSTSGEKGDFFGRDSSADSSRDEASIEVQPIPMEMEQNNAEDEEYVYDRQEFSENTIAVLSERGSTEYERLTGSLVTYIEEYGEVNIDPFRRQQTLQSLYEDSCDYLRKKDTEPFWDSGKRRVAAAVEVMAKTSVELLKHPPHMFSKDGLLENMKLECLRNRSFREAMAKNLPALAEAGNQDAYNILRFASQVERASKGKSAIITGKMPDNNCSRYREAKKLLDVSAEEEEGRDWKAEAADPAVYKETVKALSESILPKVKASEPAPKTQEAAKDINLINK